jgi:hypothetical protein
MNLAKSELPLILIAIDIFELACNKDPAPPQKKHKLFALSVSPERILCACAVAKGRKGKTGNFPPVTSPN